MHTKGPWTYEGTGSFIGGANRLRVADVFSPDLPAEERQSNARLIAAAPDLLEALQRWAQFAKDNHYTDEDYHDYDGSGWVSMTNSAIARATGK